MRAEDLVQSQEYKLYNGKVVFVRMITEDEPFYWPTHRYLFKLCKENPQVFKSGMLLNETIIKNDLK